jgi:hypothetical protein
MILDPSNNQILVANDGGLYMFDPSTSTRAFTSLNSGINSSQIQGIGPILPTLTNWTRVSRTTVLSYSAVASRVGLVPTARLAMAASNFTTPSTPTSSITISLSTRSITRKSRPPAMAARIGAAPAIHSLNSATPSANSGGLRTCKP